MLREILSNPIKIALSLLLACFQNYHRRDIEQRPARKISSHDESTSNFGRKRKEDRRGKRNIEKRRTEVWIGPGGSP